MGLILAFVALVGWGFGDFFIQKTARATGEWPAISYIGLVAGIILLPFIWQDIPTVLSDSGMLWLIGGACVVNFVGALLEVHAFRISKISIIEPIMGSELPITVLLSIALLGDIVTPTQLLLSVLVFIGIALAVTIERKHLTHKTLIFERGTIWSILSALMLAVGNVLIAMSSRAISPMFSIWATFLFAGLAALVLVALQGKLHTWARNLRQRAGLISAECFFDISGWLAYAYAVTYASVPIVITISESYIILAALLGIVLNRERLRPHQFAGATLAVASVIVLATLGS